MVTYFFKKVEEIFFVFIRALKYVKALRNNRCSQMYSKICPDRNFWCDKKGHILGKRECIVILLKRLAKLNQFRMLH